MLTMVSADGKFAVLETGDELDLMRDLMILDGGHTSYAKVLGREENGYRIGYTIQE